MKHEAARAKAMLILSMVIFGTVGLFRRYVELPSSVIATLRGLVGMVFLLIVMAAGKKRIGWQAIRKHWGMLLLSGAALGVNWMLLFEAYQYTTVATATLCYYMAPVLVTLASPLLLRERLSGGKLGCIGVSLMGMVLVSGVLDAGFSGSREWTGVLLGLAAAAFYATVVLCNKRLSGVPALDRTFVQLGVAGLALIPYDLLTEDIAALTLSSEGLLLLAVVCVVHTGAAYALYFGSTPYLPAQTLALYSYIDPLVAILCSAVLLHENIGLTGWIGAALVLGATIVSEMSPGRKQSAEG